MPIPCAHPQYDFWWTLLQYYSPRLSLSWTFKDLCRGRFNPLSFPICLVHIIACQGAFVTWGTLTFAQSHAIFIYSITYQPLNVTTSGKTHYLHSSLDACFQIIIIIVDLYNSNWKSHHKHWALQSASLCVCELCTVERPGIFPISLVFRHQPFSFVLYWCVCTSSAIFAYVCGHECEWMWMWEGTFCACAPVCASVCRHVHAWVCVCVFIHVCMSTREHWGAFRQHKAYSSSVWSCWSSELEPAACSHISSATWGKKKKDQHLWFFLLSASWTTSCWPCYACTESMKSSRGPGRSTLNF